MEILILQSPNFHFLTNPSVFVLNSTSVIVTLLDFFAQSNCYTFLETLKTFQICLQFFFDFCTIYRPEQNDVIKPFFLDLYSSGQDTMLKFCTLTNTLKGYGSKKKFQDGSHYVYFTDQNTILHFWSVKYASLIIFKFFLKNVFVMHSWVFI